MNLMVPLEPEFYKIFLKYRKFTRIMVDVLRTLNLITLNNSNRSYILRRNIFVLLYKN